MTASTYDLTVGLAPSKNTPNLPRALVVRDGVGARKTATILGFTEIEDKGRDLADMSKGLGIDWTWVGATTKSETPIAFLGKYVHERRGAWTQAHGGKSGVSPTRGTSECEFMPIIGGRYAAELAITVLVEHYTAFAFSDHFKKGTPDYEWVRAAWKVNFAKTKKRVAELHAEGRTVIVMGDYNNAGMPLYHPSQVWLVQDGICKIGLIPAAKGAAGPDVLRLKAYTLDQAGGDHDAIYARIRLTARTAAAPAPAPARPAAVQQLVDELAAVRTTARKPLPAPYTAAGADVALDAQAAINTLLAPEATPKIGQELK